MVLKREIYHELEELLAFFPAVGLLGPRQVGKTTLAKQFASARDHKTVYLDLETARDRAKLQAAHLFLNDYQDQLVILDEIHFMPELLPELRSIIDEHKRPGRFIILGSASPELLQKSAESLAGRIGYLELTPFMLEEVNEANQQKLWLRGGFPDSFLAPSDALSFTWRRNFVKTYVERDLPQLGLKVDAAILERFWKMLSGLQGAVWNAENFSRSMGITAKTINGYLNFMERAFLLHRLLPYSINVKKRLVKSPKVYIRDSGILHFLLDLELQDDLKNNIHIGASWEGFVIEQIRRKFRDEFQYYFYRTHQGTECDLLLVKRNKVVAAIEIKYSLSPQLTKGLKLSMSDLDANRGYIIIPTGKAYSISEKTEVISLSDFLMIDNPGNKN